MRNLINVRSSTAHNKKKRGHPFEYINGWEGGVKNLTGAKTTSLILSIKLFITDVGSMVFWMVNGSPTDIWVEFGRRLC